MDGNRFDQFTKSLAGLHSRRSMLRLLGHATGVAALAAANLAGMADAATCRPGGAICRKHGECCSGNCPPKDSTGRQRCAAVEACFGQGEVCCPGGFCPAGLSIRCGGPASATTI